MKPGVYRLLNRQSGTALSLEQQDYSTVVGSPPCDNDLVQMWEIASSGAGYTIRNVQTGTYISVKQISRNAPLFAGHFPASWQISSVRVDEENTELIEFRWPHTEYMFDLSNCGSSAPGTKVEIVEHRVSPAIHRCRLWKPVVVQDIQTISPGTPYEVDDDASSLSSPTTLNADMPEGGELVFTTTTTTKTVVTKGQKKLAVKTVCR